MVSRPDHVQLPAMQPLRRPSVIDQAELELRNAIYTGALRPGDAVPEVHVSQQMGISRSSLREACQRLVRDGLLTQYPGRGLFVTRMNGETMSEFIAYRLGIEMQTASLVADRVAALRASDDERAAEELLAPLRENLAQVRVALDREAVIDAGNADLDLHLTLAEISGNRFLLAAMNTIVILTRMGSFSDPLGFGVRADLPERHEELIATLAAGDSSRARALLRDTLGQLAKRMLAGESHPEVVELVRDPDLLDHPEPDWSALGGEG